MLWQPTRQQVECDSHYAEPTIATSQKEHSKHCVPLKPSGQPPPLKVQAVERYTRVPRLAQDHHRDCQRTRRWSSDRLCMSDDDADGERLRRRSAGRLSYSDDELSVHRSPRRYGPHSTCCLRQFTSSNTESDSRQSLAQSHDMLRQHDHAGSPRPVRRGCYACSSPAVSRWCSIIANC